MDRDNIFHRGIKRKGVVWGISIIALVVVVTIVLTAWLSGPACSGMFSSPKVGTECQGGSIFIGEIEDRKIFIAPKDEGNYVWRKEGSAYCANEERWECKVKKGPYGDSVIPSYTSGSENNGAINTRNLSLVSPAHPAANQCLIKSHGEHIDWYLPSKEELALIYQQRDKIPGLKQDKTDAYWSSTNINENLAYGQHFLGGQSGGYGKEENLYVRCVRSESQDS